MYIYNLLSALKHIGLNFEFREEMAKLQHKTFDNTTHRRKICRKYLLQILRKGV